MHKALWVAALAIVISGCGPDPIIGKWSLKQGKSELVTEFKPDGTRRIDTSEIEKQLAAFPPDSKYSRGMRTILDKLRQAHLTWRKKGSIYEIEGTTPGGGESPPGFVKVEGDRLLPCKEDGTSTRAPAATRVN